MDGRTLVPQLLLFGEEVEEGRTDGDVVISCVHH